jgi:multidrug resistance protein
MADAEKPGSESDQTPPRNPDTQIRSSIPDDEADLEKGDLSTTKAVSPTVEVVTDDPNVVDWDGPDDPEKPINWTAFKKWKNIFVISSLTLLTPFASSMFAPAIPSVMSDFNANSVALGAFVVSVYVLGYAFGPLIIGPMSELYGRLWVYHINTALFVIFNIACGFAQDLNTEIVLRFFAGFAGVAPMTVGSGTIADLFKQEERGKVMSAWTLPILLGPTLGPVAGSYISEALGWRWDFYTLSIAAAVMFAIAIALQDETYAITLLQRKAKKLRKETGNEKLQSALKPAKKPTDLFWSSIVRPTKMLFLSPIIFGLSLYIAVCYGYMYLVFTTITELFEKQYGIARGNVGLTFLGIGVGQFLGLFVFGGISDRSLKAQAKKNGGEMKPEYRLPPLVWGGIAMPAGLLLYGWSAEYTVHWIVPIIGTTIVGGAMILIFMPIGKCHKFFSFTSGPQLTSLVPSRHIPR